MQVDLVTKVSDPKLNLAFENHEYGLPPGFYYRFPVLSAWYNILSTSKDRNGTEYVSSMEGKKMPFFGEAFSSSRLIVPHVPDRSAV